MIPFTHWQAGPGRLFSPFAVPPGPRPPRPLSDWQHPEIMWRVTGCDGIRVPGPFFSGGTVPVTLRVTVTLPEAAPSHGLSDTSWTPGPP
eukprot:52829-Rhodomonas_salina.2